MPRINISCSRAALELLSRSLKTKHYLNLQFRNYTKLFIICLERLKEVGLNFTEQQQISNNLMWVRRLVAYGSKVKKNQISVTAVQDGVKAVSQTNQHQWEVKGPMEALLSSLAACEVATMKALTKKGDFKTYGIKFTRMETNYDLNLFLKGGETNRLQEIQVQAEVESNGSQQQLDELKKQTLHHCPVYQMLKGAGVKIEDRWKNIKIQDGK